MLGKRLFRRMTDESLNRQISILETLFRGILPNKNERMGEYIDMAHELSELYGIRTERQFSEELEE
jgi:hypothetical protein